MTSNACTDFNHTVQRLSFFWIDALSSSRYNPKVYHLSLGTEYLSQGLEAGTGRSSYAAKAEA